MKINSKIIKWKIVILWGIAVLCYLLIWQLSAQELENTAKISSNVTHFLIRTFGLPESTYMAIHDGLRTWAHVVVFFVLSSIVCIAFRLTFVNQKNFFVIPLLICLVISIVNEVQKLFIQGRHCSIIDMGLNMIGSMLGILLVYLSTVKRKKS